MKYLVCGYWYGTTVLVDEFDTREEAEEFVKHPAFLTWMDETDEEQEDVLYPDEMWGEISDGLPFEEYPKACEIRLGEYAGYEELPF